jgi:SAM-dependent methyltransferase
MRDNVKAFVRDVAELFEIPEPIYEFGSLQVSGQEGYADLRPIFPGKHYIGCDARMGVGVDRIEDLMGLSLEDETAGTVLILDTLEHVENCHRAMEDVHRILKPEGILAISSVMLFPIHEHPFDYWRFTPEAFRLLLRGFPTALVSFEGEPEIPHTVFGVASKSRLPEQAVADYLRRRSEAEPTGGPRLFSLEHERNYWRERAEAREKEVTELTARLERIQSTPIARLFSWLGRIGLTR